MDVTSALKLEERYGALCHRRAHACVCFNVLFKTNASTHTRKGRELQTGTHARTHARTQPQAQMQDTNNNNNNNNNTQVELYHTYLPEAISYMTHPSDQKSD